MAASPVEDMVLKYQSPHADAMRFVIFMKSFLECGLYADLETFPITISDRTAYLNGSP